MPFQPMSLTVLIITLLGGFLEIYKLIVLVAVVVSWLLAFNVINYHNNFVRSAVRILDTLTEPVFRQMRRIIPPIGGLDLSPILIFVIIWIVQVYVLPIIGNLLFPILH